MIDQQAIAQLSGDRWIVPGERVGPIRLWSTIGEAIAILGKPNVTGRHNQCWGEDCAHFTRYIWNRYGLVLFVQDADARGQICQINVFFSSAWSTQQAVTMVTPFKQAIDRINESIDIRYRTRCDDGGCAAYDADGMWIRANNRDDPLTDIVVYDAARALNKSVRLPIGNFPPPNNLALTK